MVSVIRFGFEISVCICVHLWFKIPWDAQKPQNSTVLPGSG
jgi:hypothetical protein